jgi:hypothetical protein
LIIEARWAYEARLHNRTAWLAWHVAALSRAKKLPTLKSMMVSKKQPQRRQTWQEQMAVMDQWAAVMRAVKKGRTGDG